MLDMRTLSIAIPAIAVLALTACGTEFTSLDEPVAAAAPAQPAPAPPALAPAVEREAFKAGGLRDAPAFTAPAAPAPQFLGVETADGASVGADLDVSTDEQVATLAAQQRIIVRTVDMTFVVSDVSVSLDAITELAQQMGGWMVSRDQRQKHRGFMSIRVPADKLDAAALRLREMAVEVKAEVSSSKDVTDEYVDATARLNNQRATEGALIKLLERAETVEDALSVQQSLTKVQEEIERLAGRLKFLEQTSAFSLINVTLELEATEMNVNAGADQTTGVAEVVRFRAFFKPPEDIDEFLLTWDFGDGSRVVTSNRTAPTEDEDTRVTATITHVYGDERDSPFFAEVKMTGTGEAGLAEGEDILVVTVTRRATIEVFAGESVTVEQDEEVEFSGSFTRPEGVSGVRFKWDFGDGSAPAVGEVEEGVTKAVAPHIYTDHRPFPYTATLTITAESDAGQVEAQATVRVRVTESAGWLVAGWNGGEQFKSAVRALSGAGQVFVSALIWIVIFSPLWVAVGVGGVWGLRRIGARRRRSRGGGE